MKNAEQILGLAELIIENSTAILFRRLAADETKDRKMVYVSPNIKRFGYAADDFLENRIMYKEIVFPGDIDRLLAELTSYEENGITEYTQTYRIVTKSGEIRWVEDRTSIWQDETSGQRYHQGIVIDIHNQKEAELKLKISEEKHRRIVESAGEGFVLMDEYFKVTECNSAFCNLLKRTRQEILGSSPFSRHDRHFWEDEPEAPAEPGAESEPSYQIFSSELIAADGTPIPVIVNGTNLRSDSDEFLGYMGFVTDMTHQKKALQLAAEVQKGLLPEKPPTIAGLDIAGRSVPCEEVGGDYFDYLYPTISQDDGLSIVVGDISGHGIDSALLMSSARACLRMRASQPGGIEEIVGELNNHLVDDVRNSGHFMTLFYLHFPADHESLQWIRAGHDPALLYDPESDSFEELKGPGIALGVLQDCGFSQQKKDTFSQNQVIAVVTDGVWEACDQHGEQFGKQRLREIIRASASRSAQVILEQIFLELEQFIGSKSPDDDISLVICKKL